MISLLLLLGAAAPPAGDDAQESHPTVERKTFTRTLTFTGSLQAVDQMVVAVPRLHLQGSPTIAYLSPEGSTVEPGTILVQFDVSDLEARRLELEKTCEEARAKIVETEANLEAQRLEQLIGLAAAEKEIKAAPQQSRRSRPSGTSRSRDSGLWGEPAVPNRQLGEGLHDDGDVHDAVCKTNSTQRSQRRHGRRGCSGLKPRRRLDIWA